MAVPQLDLSIQHAPLMPAFRQAVQEVLESGQFCVQTSPFNKQLENWLGQVCACTGVTAMSSGTDALLAALMALGIGVGDEVITTPFTFFATAGCISRVGAKPVFVDIDPGSYNLDPALIEAAITPRTKAIMPVHLYGLMADMDPIMALAKRHKLKVIEDAAQSIGARDAGRPAGSIGDIGALSFYPTKNLGALGDAGACVTNSAELDRKLKVLRLHGQTGEYQHEYIGGNFRLDAIQAALLNVKATHLDKWTQLRRGHAQRYHELLKGLPLVLPGAGATPGTLESGKYHVYNQYTVRVPDGKREALRKHLTAQGVGCRVYYPLSLHQQPCFAYLGGRAGQFPQTERATQEVLSLPMFPEMTPAQQDQAAAAVRGFYQG